jgi:hypothetical protein
MKARSLVGAAAVLCAALSLNLLVWREDPFSWVVLLPMLAAVVLGAAWSVWVLLGIFDRSSAQGSGAGGLNAVFSSTLFLGICVMVYVFVRGWDVSWDLTKEGRRDLAPQTVKVLQSMTEEVEVLCFFSAIDEEVVLIARDKTLRFLEECRKHSALLKVESLDPDMDWIRLRAAGFTYASPQGTIVINAEGRNKVITLSGGSPRLEEQDFTNALVNVLRGSQPKIYFLEGHGERDPADKSKEGTSVLSDLLAGESYLLDKFSMGVLDAEVPEDCDVLVIDNIKKDLQPQEIAALKAYMARGGRLLTLFDPWPEQDGVQERFRPYLASEWGIRVADDILLSKERKKPWQVEFSNDESMFSEEDEGFGDYVGAYHARHPITLGFDQAVLFQACRSTGKADEVPSEVILTELVRTPSSYWGEMDVLAMQDGEGIDRGEEEALGPHSVAVAGVRRAPEAEGSGKPLDSRIVVLGNSSFASNQSIKLGGNLNLVLNVFGWLTEQEDLIAIRPTGKTDNPLILSTGERRAVAWVSTLLTLQLVVAAGLLVYLTRRKHQ